MTTGGDYWVTGDTRLDRPTADQPCKRPPSPRSPRPPEVVTHRRRGSTADWSRALWSPRVVTRQRQEAAADLCRHADTVPALAASTRS